MRLVFDIETDGFLEEVSKIHCMVAKEADTGAVHTFRPHQIMEGLELLAEAGELCGHNIIGYDLPVIQKLHPKHYEKLISTAIRDTLVLSRVRWPEIRKGDFKRVSDGNLPGKLLGSHSLEAWGCRLGILKGSYGKQENAWEQFSEEMLQYNILDVEVTCRLLEAIDKKPIDPRCKELEHAVAWILAHQMRTGYPFDEAKARELYVQLAAERETLRAQAVDAIQPWYVPERKAGQIVVKTPKVGNKKYRTEKGAPWVPVKLMELNPGSDQQVVDRLKKLHGWEPEEYTENGQAKCTDEILEHLEYPEAKIIGRFRMLEKRCSQLAEGDQALIKVATDGRIHGYINSGGTVTGRCTHSRPNLAQIPAVRAAYGKEFRALFYVPEVFHGRRYVQFGTDLSGIELRLLSHYMARYDGGAYGKELLTGDVHTLNQKASGLPTRDAAKTFAYAWLYGAGAAKIGKIVGKDAREGKRLINAFLKRTPALKKLREKVQSAAARGYIVGLDGRRIPIRSAHSALNSLLQSGGAVIAKAWMVHLHRILADEGYELGLDYYQLCFCHDELQLMIPEEITDAVRKAAERAAALAGEQFQLRIPIECESKTGRNWEETH